MSTFPLSDRPNSTRALGQKITIREADSYGKVKCNRCKRPLRGGQAGDARRDPARQGYICKAGCGPSLAGPFPESAR